MWGLLLVLGVGVLAGGLALSVDRLLRKERREGDIDAIGFVFAVVGVLYAIVLAFVVIEVWSQWTDAQENANREATALIEEYRYAQTLPEAQRLDIQQLCESYANHVIHNEWPQLRRHETVGAEGYALVDRLRTAVEVSKPADTDTDRAQLAYTNAVAQATTLAQARDARLAAASTGLPSVLWFVLIGGALVVVAFAYVFDVAGVGVRMILAVGLTVMTVLLLWCIFQLEYPFARQLHIDPSAFQFALARFVQLGKS